MENNNCTQNETIAINDNFIKQANIQINEYNNLLKAAKDDYFKFWGDLANKYIKWNKPFTKIINDSNKPFYKWFEDGLLNVSYNCLDIHLSKTPDKIAIIYESDNGLVTKITYKDLYEKVCLFANGLKSIGVKKADRCIIYLPNSIEVVVAMQACARIGAIHSVVFGGFSSRAISDRIIDTQAKIIITADSQIRGGKIFLLKNNVDEALNILNDEGRNSIQDVIVANRNNTKINWVNNRDIWWHELIKKQNNICEPEIVESEHPLFILYTSGSTGKPKGIQHASAGYLLGAIVSLYWIFDIKKDNDIFWCTADVGWITGHTYMVYGALASGITQVIYEGVPTYPTVSRYWEIISKHKVTIFYTSPTAIRTLIKADVKEVFNDFDLSSLRLLGSVGEVINKTTWLWYYKNIGKSKCPIIDTWWQTETGSCIMSPLPGIHAMKPGSCRGSIPGIEVDIIDEKNNSMDVNVNGYLIIKKPFPSQLRTIWGNDLMYKSKYFPENIANGAYYVAGDTAHYDYDNYIWVVGRFDDVLNVSGHRIGTAEIETVLTMHANVIEAAAVGVPHPIKGEVIHAFIVCKNLKEYDSKIELIKDELKSLIASEIGSFAKPEAIEIVDNLPKTRSGKVMRRLIRAIARNEDIMQDISTLEQGSMFKN